MKLDTSVFLIQAGLLSSFFKMSPKPALHFTSLGDTPEAICRSGEVSISGTFQQEDLEEDSYYHILGQIRPQQMLSGKFVDLRPPE
jgi:hypothetical protein